MPNEHRYFKPLLADGGARRRSHAELLTLVQTIVADGVVAADEATFLARWIVENESLRDTWPASVLYARVEAMLADGVLDADEQHELLATMLRFVELRQTAERNRAEVDSLLDSQTGQEPAASPFDRPTPAILHAGHRFVLAGDFASARRRDVEGLIMRLGGKLDDDLSGTTDFLIVGDLGIDTWNSASHAPLIERALQLRQAGAGVRIVSEQDWHAAVAGLRAGP
jgi:hypothetical protein